MLLAALAAAQDITSFEKRIRVKKLENGLTLIVCERPEAPVFSFFTLVDAGSVQDPMRQTGLAHMFEHMAFKGTDKIGTTDYAAEKPALEKVETAYAAYIAERDKTVGRDEAKLKELEKAWKDAIAAADKYVVPNQFGKIVEQNGGQDLNAFTDYDETGYHYSLPSNRLELWAYLESERFLHPGAARILQRAQRGHRRAPPAHRQQSHRPSSGTIHRGRIRGSSLSPADRRMDVRFEFLLGYRCEEVFRQYYVPANMVVAVAGDVKAEQ
jgi:predicted Zn-dependent peptidase